MKVTDDYVFFYGQTCFSQWFRSTFKIDGVTYSCAEQYMMAEKARLFGDKEMEKKIMEADHPRDQKAYGRKVKGFDSAKWNAVAKDVVFRANEAKFSQNPQLKKQLMDTENRTLVEASGYDKIWGIGLWDDDPRCLNPETWQGTNWLGEVLTKLRDQWKS